MINQTRPTIRRFLKGFTTLQMVAALSAMVILVGIAMPKQKSIQDTAKTMKAKSTLKTVKAAVEGYKIGNKKYPPKTGSLVKDHLMKAKPKLVDQDMPDPFGGDLGYAVTPDRSKYALSSKGVDGESGTSASIANGVIVTSGDDLVDGNVTVVRLPTGVTCGTDETNCNGVCITTSTNASHCGDCDTVCSGASNTCVAGVCKCGDAAACSGTTDTCTDGVCMCGVQESCFDDEACVAGACVTPTPTPTATATPTPTPTSTATPTPTSTETPIVEYTITFDPNGGSGSMADQTLATAASANLTFNAFIRTDYAFAGWATTAGGVVVYADGANYTMGSGNVTLYAKWVDGLSPVVTLTLPVDKGTYRVAGSSLSFSSTDNIGISSCTVTLGAETQTFTGLNNGANTVHFTTTTSSNYIDWSVSCTDGVNTTVSSSRKVKVDASASPLHCADYQAAFGRIDSFEMSRLLAYWRSEGYHVASSSLDGYITGAGSQDGPYHCADTDYDWVISTSEANVVQSLWGCDNDGYIYRAALDTWVCASGYTTVTYYTEFGEAPIDSNTYQEGETVTVLGDDSLVAEGYTFAGWNALIDGSGTTYASGETFTMGIYNVMLYAKWTALIVNGQACTNPDGSECESGNCTNSVCCAAGEVSTNGACGTITPTPFPDPCDGKNPGEAATGTTALCAGSYAGYQYMVTASSAVINKVWSTVEAATGVTGRTDGAANTVSLSALGPGYEAASYCADLNEGGYVDWFLPAADELGAFYANRGALGMSDNNKYYWTSTESYASQAFTKPFWMGAQDYTMQKTARDEYRATRCFRRY